MTSFFCAPRIGRFHIVAVAATILLCACSEPQPPAQSDSRPDLTRAQSNSAEPADSTTPGSSPVKVLFFGDSITAGYGLQDETDAFPFVFERIAVENGFDVDITASGNSGETTAGGLRRIDWVMRTPYDVVVIELGGNDGLRGVPASNARANLAAIVRKVREHAPNSTVVVAGMRLPPSMGAAYVGDFESIYEQVADDTGSKLLPFILQDVGGVSELNQRDGIHPTAKGHEIIGRNVWLFLKPILESTRVGS